ncbi:hypothetical protein HA402_014152 [Bradysia odoriphaga]|nr:hypothetical protein HA402_014152 [Bradysia odoriphaga]
MFLVFLVVGGEYSLAARKSSSPNSKPTGEMLPAPKNSTSNSKQTGETLPAPKNSTTNSKQADKPPMAAEKDQLVAPGITVSKGFKKTNCSVDIEGNITNKRDCHISGATLNRFNIY